MAINHRLVQNSWFDTENVVIQLKQPIAIKFPPNKIFVNGLRQSTEVNFQQIEYLLVDCDNLLILVRQSIDVILENYQWWISKIKFTMTFEF